MYCLPKLKIAVVTSIIVFVFVFSSCQQPETVVEDYSPIDIAALKVGDTIMPFRYINPKDHDWRVVVRVSGEDLVDVSHKLTTRMFSTTDTKVLQRIRKWKFVYRKQGVVDASSTIRVFKNDELEDTYGIVLEKRWLRIQSKKIGVLESVRHDELLDILKEMN